jgi:transmembrane sensor
MKYENNRHDLAEMIRKYISGTATPEEIRFIEAYYDSFEQKENILNQYPEGQMHDLQQEMFRNIIPDHQIPLPNTRTKSLWIKTLPWTVAAGLIIGIYWVLFQTQKEETHISVNQPVEIPSDFTPGTNHATLTWADGQLSLLDTLEIGDEIHPDQSTIIKTSNKGIVYKPGHQDVSGAPKYHLLQTPYGGQYQVTLSEGTKVWLNAKSSIQYPVNFTDSIRKVFITGECFLEVAKDVNRPFVVIVNNKQEIKVTGTKFNINAYTNEPFIETTLHSGQIFVKSIDSQYPGTFTHLKPGQQYAQSPDGTFQIKRVDLSESIAWIKNQFQFTNEDIQAVMRQISRWYQVEVAYEQNLPRYTFSGKIDRSAKASQVLEILKFTGVKFRIEATENPDYKGKIILIP